MSEPDLVTAHLGDEDVLATVNLSGEDRLFITPTRSLLYEAEGLISDESVSEFSHDIESIAVSRGRRKTTIELNYPLDGTKTFRVPNRTLDSVLHYLVAGVLNARSITNPGEIVRAVYLFNELTVVITSERVVTNVGASVWDQDHDEYPYGDLTGLEFEEGDVATQIVMYVNGRSQRIKAPKSEAKRVSHELRQAVFEYFDVSSMPELGDVLQDDTNDASDKPSEYPFEDAVEPLNVSSTDQSSDDAVVAVDREEETAPGRAESADALDDIEDALTDLQEAIEHQRNLLAAQEKAIEHLVESLSQHR